jgi:hypothetical protein
MTNSKRTSNTVGSKAGSVLANSNSSAIAKSLAASALSQAGTSKQTGARMEEKAAAVLGSEKYSAVTRALAGSVVSQSNKKR